MSLPVDFDEQLKLYLSYYKEHMLLTVTETDPVSVYTLKRLGTGNMHVCVVFANRRIGLTGDACLGPTQHGLWSVGGYGLPWFAGDLSPGYLCEKFLRKSYDAKATADRILDWYKEALAEEGDEETVEAFKERVSELTVSSGTIEEQIAEICEDNSERGALGDLLNGDFAGLDFETPCYTYGELAAPLVAVQKTFARLYSKEEKKTNALRNN